MTLLLPLGLLGLLALPIIMLLHLQRERPRRMRVPSVQFWQRLASEQAHPEPKRLPITLLLLLHLLVAGLLALALARPALPGLSPSRATHTLVLLDTSTSMAAEAGGASRFQQALARVQALGATVNGDDVLTVIGLSPEARLLVRQRPAGSAEPLPLDTLAPAGEGLDLRGGLNLANGLLDSRRANRIIFLTDATWHPESLDSLALPIGAPISWETFGGPVANQAIVAFAARPLPTGGNSLIARVANYADAPAERTLRLLAPDGSVLADTPLQLAASGEQVGSWTLNEGVTAVTAELSGSDSQPTDDRATLALSPTGSAAGSSGAALPVRIIGPEPEALRRILNALPGVALDNTVPPEQAALTIFNGQLPEVPPPGAVLLLNPPTAPTWEPASETPRESAALPLGEDPLVRGLDWTTVRFPAVSTARPPWAETVLADDDGNALLWRGTTRTARVVALNFDLERSNLPAKLAFPLLMARIVAELTPVGVPATVPLGSPIAFPWNTTEFRVLAPDGNPLPIADGGRARTVRPLVPGLYTVELGGRPVTAFAAQGGAPLESDLRPAQPERLPGLMEVPIFEQSPAIPVRDLAPWLVAGVLGLLLLEQLYERRGRRA